MKILAYLFPLVFIACNLQRPDSKSILLNVGVITSASSEATQAGMEILQKGGNAIDAAVAVSFALGLTEPAMSGLGGGTQILLSIPNKKPISINGTTWSPAATPIDATKTDLTYHRKSTIPSTVKVLDYAWRKYGSQKITWADLLQPAIDYAEKGFAIGPFRHKVYKKYEKALRESPYATAYWLMPDGTIPAIGDTIYQPVLAQTMRRLAQKGAADFYQGEIAQLIAQDMATNQGWITLEDLQNFPDPIELEPLKTSYRGYDIYTQPPPCGGWTVLMILNLLESFDKNDLNNPESRAEKLLQALHIAHKNRSDLPVEDLKNYTTAIQEKISKAYATKLLEDFSKIEQPTFSNQTDNGETTHFSVVDKNGMAVAVTASINAYFGAKAAAPKLGFLYNTYMDDFELGQPEHPFAIRPQAMAYSSMSPTIVQKDGATVLVLGSPGSARIISAVAQITQLWIDSDLGIKKIVAMPRFHAVNGKMYLENIENHSTTIQNLRKKGFEIAFPTYDLMQNERNAYFGGVHAIAKENGRWKGVADIRRDGLAAQIINP